VREENPRISVLKNLRESTRVNPISLRVLTHCERNYNSDRRALPA